MRKYLVGLMLVLVTGSALGFPATLEVVDRKAEIDDPAEFDLRIENSLGKAATFRISSITAPSPTNSWFSYPNARNLNPGETSVFKIRVKPSERAVQQNYRFDVNVRTITGDSRQKVSDYFSVDTGNGIKILSTSTSSKSLKPGEEIRSNLTVLNTAPRPVNYQVTTTLLDSSSEQSGALVPGTSRKHSVNFDIPENTSPGNYTLKTSISSGSADTDSISSSIKVKEVRDVERSVERTEGLLEYTRILEARNRGNSEASVELNRSFPGYLEPLVDFQEAPDSVSDSEDGKVYSWELSIPPGEKASISYRVRYWPPLVVVTLLFSGLILLRKMYTGIGFSKSVERRGEEVKVHLELRNGSGHKIRDLKVTDFVPDIASVSEEFPMADPVVRKTDNGTRLSWEVEEMEPGEQRVFEYTIKPLIEVEGGATLSAAELERDERKIKETSEQTVEFRPE